MNPPTLDPYDLYELCVQSPPDLVPLLRAVHGGNPRILGEDFCGTGALSAEWVRRVEGGRAIAVDHDEEALVRAPAHESIEIVHGDVIEATSPERHGVDILYAGNFSIGEWTARADLLAYLRHARTRLRPDGVFVCDIYGGETAFLVGRIDREHEIPDGRTIRYTWEQREADPLTGRVVNVLHFEVLRDGRVEQQWPDAFIYRWRLWSVPELREAMLEAGLRMPEVYPRVPEAVDDDGCAYVTPFDDASTLEDSFDVLLAARVSQLP